MAWNLGLLGAAGGGGGAGAYDLLETVQLSASTPSIEFTNLNSTYGSDYKHLQIRSVSQTDKSTGGENIMMHFNNDTSSNYAFHLLVGNGSSVESYNSVSVNSLRGTYAGVENNTSAYGGGILDILDAFSTSKYTTIRNLTGISGAAGNEIQMYSGLWMSTNAISSITFFPLLGSNITAGTRFSLYGIKAA